MKEDETIINCSNLENSRIWKVYSTQKKIVTKLLRCSSFKKVKDIIFKGKKIGVEGILPFNAITIRKMPHSIMKSELKTDSEGAPNDL